MWQNHGGSTGDTMTLTTSGTFVQTNASVPSWI